MVTAHAGSVHSKIVEYVIIMFNWKPREETLEVKLNKEDHEVVAMPE